MYPDDRPYSQSDHDSAVGLGGIIAIVIVTLPILSLVVFSIFNAL